MTTKPTKIMAEQQREVPLLQRPANPDDGSFSWLTVLGFAFLTFNSAMAIYRSDGELYAVVFVAFSYVDVVLLFYCLRQFEKAEANSPAREKLKVAVWVLTTLLTVVFSYKVASIMPLPVQVLVWAMAGATVLGGFYAFFLHLEGEIMAPIAVPTSSFALRSVLDKEKLNGTNFADWSRNLRIVLRQDKKEHVLEEPIPDVPAESAAATLKNAYKKACDESLDVSCLMLAAMNSDLQKQFENIEAYDMIVALKGMFETQARTERYEISKNLFGCKLTEGSPVSPHVIKMVGYTQSLEKLGFPLSQELATDLILASLPASYGQFILNFHMNGLDKNLTELHMMLKTAEDSIKKSNSHVMMVQKSTSFKKKARTWVKGKGKKVSDVIQTNKPKPKTKSGPTQENECFYCKEPGHWKRNCKKYLADLKKKGGSKPSTSESNKE